MPLHLAGPKEEGRIFTSLSFRGNYHLRAGLCQDLLLQLFVIKQVINIFIFEESGFCVGRSTFDFVSSTSFRNKETRNNTQPFQFSSSGV